MADESQYQAKIPSKLESNIKDIPSSNPSNNNNSSNLNSWFLGGFLYTDSSLMIK